MSHRDLSSTKKILFIIFMFYKYKLDDDLVNVETCCIKRY